MALKILISQQKPQKNSPYDELLRKYNVEIDFQKFIKIEGLPAKEFKKQKIRFLEFPSVIFTSRIAIDNYFRIAKEMRWNIPNTMIYFCINETVALYLQKYTVYRKRKIFFANGDFDNLVDIIQKNKKADKFLLPVTENHKNTLIAKLKRNKIDFTKVILYRTVNADLKKIDIDSYDIIAIFSPAGIKSLIENFPDKDWSDTKIAVFGTEAQKFAKKHNLKIDIKAPTKIAQTMAAALNEFLKKQNVPAR